MRVVSEINILQSYRSIDYGDPTFDLAAHWLDKTLTHTSIDRICGYIDSAFNDMAKHTGFIAPSEDLRIGSAKVARALSDVFAEC